MAESTDDSQASEPEDVVELAQWLVVVLDLWVERAVGFLFIWPRSSEDHREKREGKV